MSQRSNTEWVDDLRGAQAATALDDLRLLLMRSLSFALSTGVTEADIEDFVQDGLIRILHELDSFRGESQFVTWAQKVAIRVAYTELRRRRWRDVSLQDVLDQFQDDDFTPDILADRASDPARIATRRMMMDAIERIIATELTTKQRQAMMAVMRGGMPLQEVADRMGMTRGALYKLLHDARKRLQQRMLSEGLTPDDVRAAFEKE